MYCKNCDFLCYEEEYICPYCDSVLDEKLPRDETEKNKILLDYIALKKKKEKKGKIARKVENLYFILYFFNLIVVGSWIGFLSTVTKRGPDTDGNVLGVWYMLPLLLFVFLVGLPWITSYKKPKTIRNGYGLSRKLGIGKNIELIIYLLIGLLLYFLWPIAKDMVIYRYTRFPAPKFEQVGMEKLLLVFKIVSIVQYVSVLIFYSLCNIFDLRDEKEEFKERKKAHEKKSYYEELS